LGLVLILLLFFLLLSNGVLLLDTLLLICGGIFLFSFSFSFSPSVFNQFGFVFFFGESLFLLGIDYLYLVIA